MKSKWKSFYPSFIAMLFALLVWEISVYFFKIEKWLLPAPTVIIKELVSSISTIQMDLFSTTWVAFSGLVVGCSIGIITASWLHLYPFSKKLLYPLIVFSQNVPMIALAPLLIVWFGFSIASKIMIVFLVCFFPITVATLDGFYQANQSLRTYLEMEGASRWTIFFSLEWPSALPSFFSGLKLSASYCVMAAVIAEWLGANHGLGIVMTLSAHSFRTDRVFVAILLIMLLSVLLFSLVTLIERKVIFWQQEKR